MRAAGTQALPVCVLWWCKSEAQGALDCDRHRVCCATAQPDSYQYHPSLADSKRTMLVLALGSADAVIALPSNELYTLAS